MYNAYNFKIIRYCTVKIYSIDLLTRTPKYNEFLTKPYVTSIIKISGIIISVYVF